jgi:dihydrodipicolinate synthase/N-acetylneuraminate lyase
MLLEGIFAAATTPFYPDERVYFRKLEHNIARLSLSGLSGMVILGSTGEAVALDDAESREVLRVAAESAAAEKVLLAGVARESVKATLDLAEAAAEFGYDAVLVRNPSYYRPQLTDLALLTYCRAIADRSALPVVLYSIPRFTEMEIPLGVVKDLADHPNVIGLKDSSGKVERIAAVVEATRAARRRTVTVTPVFEAVTGRMQKVTPAVGSATFVSAEGLASGVAVATPPPMPTLKTRTKEVGFQVLTGSPSSLVGSLDAGAAGAVLAFASCAPQTCQEIYTAWKEHDRNLAMERQTHITEASKVIGNELGIAGLKAACDFNGFYGGYPRLPLLPLDAATRARVEGLLAEIRN